MGEVENGVRIVTSPPVEGQGPSQDRKFSLESSNRSAPPPTRRPVSVSVTEPASPNVRSGPRRSSHRAEVSRSSSGLFPDWGVNTRPRSSVCRPSHRDRLSWPLPGPFPSSCTPSGVIPPQDDPSMFPIVGALTRVDDVRTVVRMVGRDEASSL